MLEFGPLRVQILTGGPRPGQAGPARILGIGPALAHILLGGLPLGWRVNLIASHLPALMQIRKSEWKVSDTDTILWGVQTGPPWICMCK